MPCVSFEDRVNRALIAERARPFINPRKLQTAVLLWVRGESQILPEFGLDTYYQNEVSAANTSGFSSRQQSWCASSESRMPGRHHNAHTGIWDRRSYIKWRSNSSCSLKLELLRRAWKWLICAQRRWRSILSVTAMSPPSPLLATSIMAGDIGCIRKSKVTVRLCIIFLVEYIGRTTHGPHRLHLSWREIFSHL